MTTNDIALSNMIVGLWLIALVTRVIKLLNMIVTELRRPSDKVRPRVSFDGMQFVATDEFIVGSGKSPLAAVDDYNKRYGDVR